MIKQIIENQESIKPNFYFFLISLCFNLVIYFLLFFYNSFDEKFIIKVLNDLVFVIWIINSFFLLFTSLGYLKLKNKSFLDLFLGILGLLLSLFGIFVFFWILFGFLKSLKNNNLYGNEKKN